MKRPTGWRLFKLGDLGRVVTGRTPPSSEPNAFGNDYPFITPSDMDGRRKMDHTERYLSPTGASIVASCLVPERSIAVSCIGWQMGKAVLTTRPSFTNQQLNTIVPNDRIAVPEFLYYAMSIRQTELKNLGSAGTRTPILNKSRFEALAVLLPPLPAQFRIADILSAYDDLIENNTKRIKILEAMARSLYREWFVNFRFPGHEKVKLVNSPDGKVPEGWTLRRLGDIADVQWGDTSTTKASYRPTGFIAYSASGPDGFLDHADFEREGVVLSAIGAQCGKTWYARGLWSCIKNTIRFWSKDELAVSTAYLYYATQDPTFWPRRGAAQPFISQGDARLCWVLVPKVELIQRFTALVAATLLHQSRLAMAADTLRRTRDLLLPRLISGEIDVSRLEAPGA
ncbi:restriction endonuclease subunit S [Sorangium sp. So ce1128]